MTANRPRRLAIHLRRGGMYIRGQQHFFALSAEPDAMRPETESWALDSTRCGEPRTCRRRPSSLALGADQPLGDRPRAIVGCGRIRLNLARGLGRGIGRSHQFGYLTLFAAKPQAMGRGQSQ